MRIYVYLTLSEFWSFYRVLGVLPEKFINLMGSSPEMSIFPCSFFFFHFKYWKHFLVINDYADHVTCGINQYLIVFFFFKSVICMRQMKTCTYDFRLHVLSHIRWFIASNSFSDLIAFGKTFFSWWMLNVRLLLAYSHSENVLVLTVNCWKNTFQNLNLMRLLLWNTIFIYAYGRCKCYLMKDFLKNFYFFRI